MEPCNLSHRLSLSLLLPEPMAVRTSVEQNFGIDLYISVVSKAAAILTEDEISTKALEGTKNY